MWLTVIYGHSHKKNTELKKNIGGVFGKVCLNYSHKFSTGYLIEFSTYGKICI